MTTQTTTKTPPPVEYAGLVAMPSTRPNRSHYSATHEVFCPACDAQIGQLYPGRTYDDWCTPAWWPRERKCGVVSLAECPGDPDHKITATQQGLEQIANAHRAEGHAPKRRVRKVTR